MNPRSPTSRPTPTPAALTDLARRLAAEAPMLRKRPVREISEVLGRTGERFLDDADELRREALDRLPDAAALSPEMARVILGGMARDWTRPRLDAWLDAEFRDPRCLDGLVDVAGRRLMAVGPALCTQIVSGSVPGVGVNALLRSLMVKAPTLLKPGLGDVVLPELFARGLGEVDPGLARAVAVTYWPGGSVELERAALSMAESVVVYGSDETVSAIRTLTPPTARLVAYHHRIGVAVVGRDALGDGEAGGAMGAVAAGGAGGATRAALEVARAVAVFEQRGCVCPHLIFVEEGGVMAPREFAQRVSDAFARLATALPSAPLPLEEASAVPQLRGNAELWAGEGGDAVWHGGSDATWSVIYESEARPGPAAVGRAARVRPIGDASKLAEALAPMGAHLQTVGFTGLGERAPAMCEALGRAGASRVCELDAVSFPPPWWMHDGRGGLQDLVRWVELETSLA